MVAPPNVSLPWGLRVEQRGTGFESAEERMQDGSVLLPK